MGRPREFDPEETLQDILNIFWLKGYEGASLQDLEAATGLKKPSLYRTYGDKRAMYLAALAAYDATEVGAAMTVLQKPGSARAKIQRLLNGVVDGAAGKGDRRGCFLCNASIDQAPHDASTRKLVRASMERLSAAFSSALEAAPAYKASAAKREKMAAKILAGYFGLRVMIKAGMPVETLRKTVSQIVSEIEP